MIGNINAAGAGYYNSVTVVKPDATGKIDTKDMSEAEIRRKKQTGEIECSTCSNRTYVDGSDDPGVSFKTPAKVSPEQSASKVMSHEMEHYNRESSEANREGREVVSNSIEIYRAVCPECGSSYVSGGQTTTVTRKIEENNHFKEQSYNKNIAVYFGKKLDTKV